jgi:phosphoglucosamine mutase
VALSGRECCLVYGGYKLLSLFGTSGIRGRVNEELAPESCLAIGKAIGSILPIASKVCLSTDTRVSKDVIKSALISGLLSVGINVTDLGVLPTPALALLSKELDCNAGIMITASHNPPSYNGIKLFNRDSLGFSAGQEKEIEGIYLSQQFRHTSWQECGSLTREEKAGEEYLLTLKKKASSWKCDSHIKLVIDPGNGAACKLATAFFQELGFEVFPINDEPNGLFPGRGSEPTPETLQGTIKFLNDCGADLAICFDGDADRVIFCDRQGFLGYNEMIAFISRLAIKESGKSRVATTVETGGFLDAAVADLNAEVFRTKVGDVSLAHYTKELDAAIGVEQVGVYILPQVGYYPDSFLASLFLLSHIHATREIRDFYSHLPPLFFEKAKIPCADELRAKTMEICQTKLANFGGKVNNLDGIRMDFPDSWILIRPSGTEPVIRVLTEADSKEKATRLIAQGTQLIKEAIIQTGEKA